MAQRGKKTSCHEDIQATKKTESPRKATRYNKNKNPKTLQPSRIKKKAHLLEPTKIRFLNTSWHQVDKNLVCEMICQWCLLRPIRNYRNYHQENLYLEVRQQELFAIHFEAHVDTFFSYDQFTQVIPHYAKII